MSTSTVSATANPRRRPSSTVNDVKQSTELVKDTVTTPTTAAVDNGGDKIAAVKSGVRTRTRKPVASITGKQAKPRWKRILSVLVKNLVLVVVVLGLVQIIRKLVIRDQEGNGGVFGFSEMESRISSVEKSMKMTAKMLQVQVEVVDKKIESEVGNLRREIGRRVEDKGKEIERKLRDIGAKSDGLEAGLREMRDVSKGFVSKDEVVRLYDELMSGKDGNVEGSGLSLDEIRGLAREIVEKEIEKHAADGLGRVDYALGSGGARVVKHSEPLMVGKGIWLPVPRHGVHENAVRMLSPSFGEPGMCFALKGSSGFVQIRLRTAIVPEAVTLEHVAKTVAYDQSSAPKDCRIFGWLQGKRGTDTESNDDSEKVVLAEFAYDLEKSNAQTYNVLDSAESAVIDTVSFEFSSNQGSSTHTCIYRLRVHGHDPHPVPKLA